MVIQYFWSNSVFVWTKYHRTICWMVCVCAGQTSLLCAGAEPCRMPLSLNAQAIFSCYNRWRSPYLVVLFRSEMRIEKKKKRRKESTTISVKNLPNALNCSKIARANSIALELTELTRRLPRHRLSHLIQFFSFSVPVLIPALCEPFVIKSNVINYGLFKHVSWLDNLHV